MKPIKLEFEGINSFSEHTIIDFEALTKNGIFGIFGDTGSGKSTILDCINFALYGSVERSREKTDIINYRCDAAKVNFTFSALSEGKRKIYLVERVLKKDKYGTHKAALYEDGICIAEKTTTVEDKISKIIGVDADDFRKCIALPQGEFAQFVKSAPRERLALIERMFSLSKYGDRLKEKLSLKQAETESEYQNVFGRLQTYSDATQEALNAAYTGGNELKSRFEELNKSEAEISEKCKNLKFLNDKLHELERAKKDLEEAEKRRIEIEEMRRGYAVLPICKEAATCSAELEEKKKQIECSQSDIKKLGEEINRLQDEISKTEIKIAQKDYDGQIELCVNLSAKYGATAGKAEKLNLIYKQLKDMREDYALKSEKLSKLERSHKIAENERKEAEQALSECNGADFDSLSGGLEGAILKKEYIANLDYFCNFGGNIKVYKEESPLYNYVSGEIEGKIDEYRRRIDDVKEFSYESVTSRLEKIREISQKREKLQKALSDRKEAEQRAFSAVEISKNELKAAAKEGAELKKRYEEIEEELRQVFGGACKDYSAAIKQNEENLSALKREKEEDIKYLEGLKNRKNEFAISAEKVNALCLSSQDAKKVLEEKLALAVEKSGLKSIEKCLETVDIFEKNSDAGKTLEEEEDRFKRLIYKVEELTKTEGIFGATDDVLSSAECEKSNISGGLSKISAEIAVNENECNTLKRRLFEKAEIEKELQKVKNTRTLLAKLKEITKNNKFLEYIADEYLCDISALASSTLLKLKDGRYFLTYKDNNFQVGDNFDCGKTRGVNTLSGGETFLVSLSLAIALSQTICSKSLKSIEFFFLDEGFGTLDSTLVDTVMNALEKLKNADFTIGIISHVEELKNRIDCKITVNKATETHGSTVSVSC